MMQWKFIVAGVAAGLATFASLAQQSGVPSRGDLSRGQTVFESECFDCHNADSNIAKAGPGFKGVRDGKLPSGADATRENILAVVNGGVGEDMPPFDRILTQQEKEDVVAYVLSR